MSVLGYVKASTIVELEPEELAGIVLAVLNAEHPRGGDCLNAGNFVGRQGLDREGQRALMEAWWWLEREGMLVRDPSQHGDWLIISRRGRRMLRPEDLAAYRNADRLPRHLLHPRLATGVWPAFLRGQYDVAVFQSFKEVEVAVREASDSPPERVGVDLVRRAFAAQNGPLTDRSAPAAEQEALASLFAGAIGSYKNPTSHRHVGIDADEAVEMIILACHLLRIVDGRRQGGG